MGHQRLVSFGVIVFIAMVLLFHTVRRHTGHSLEFGGLSENGNPPTDELPTIEGRKFAYATFLAGKDGGHGANIADDDSQDGYFLSARVLVYQLLHSPTVRGNGNIPFIILVTEDVSKRKRDRLARDGAIVIPVEKLYSEWITPKQGRWQDVLTKLRLFEMIQYDKICFIDADHLVTQPLEGVFDDPAAMVQTTLQDPSIKDEAPIPDSYIFASKTEAAGYGHPYPPEEGNYLNIGFFVLGPNKMLFNYYVTLMRPEYANLFSPEFPEQNLMNYAHRKNGKMPWYHLWYGWNMNWPTENDMRGGAHSFHAKYWEGDPTHDSVLKAIWQDQRAEMEGYWRGKEE